MAERSWRASARAALARWIILLALATSALGAAQTPKVVINASDGAERAAVRVELAVTPGQRTFGLMYREHLDDDAGMLFIFPAVDQLKFWMKHTEIPLDMIFADPAGGVVGIVANATPYWILCAPRRARGRQDELCRIRAAHHAISAASYAAAGRRRA